MSRWRSERTLSPRARRSAAVPWQRVLLLAGIVLGLVVVSAFILGVIGGGSCQEQYCPTEADAPLPSGYAQVSDVFELRQPPPELPEGAEYELEIALRSPTSDPRNLVLFALDEDGTWRPLGNAVLSGEGSRARATVSELPKTVVVLRRISPAGHLIAYLPHGAGLHPAAAERATIVHTVDFRPAADGTVEGTPTSLPPLENAAWIPTIRASATDTGTLANVDAILVSPESRSTHVNAILQLVRDLDAEGIDIAYLDLRPDLRASFALFVLELSQALHKDGKLLTLTLPPPVQLADGSMDEGAYDWRALGEAADVLQLTPFRDQRLYRLQMPDILEYLKTLVPAEKLVLTVTPYATEAADGELRTLRLADAMRIAAAIQQPDAEGPIEPNQNVEIVAPNIDRNEGLSGVVWDPNTATVSFSYRQNGNRTVWIENVFSVSFKLELVSQHRLGGVAVEDASADPLLGDIWPAIASFADTGQPQLRQPNGEELVPRWSASGGTIEGGQRGRATWTAPPQPGSYTITLQLSDGVYRFENSVSVSVTAREQAQRSAAAASDEG